MTSDRIELCILNTENNILLERMKKEFALGLKSELLTDELTRIKEVNDQNKYI